MKNPTTETGYTKEGLRKYALYRKEREFSRIETYLAEDPETEDSENEREPLDISVEKVVKIQLSWGGDEDGYKLTFNKDDTLIGGLYYWADWGVYEEVYLSDEEADQIYDLFLFSDVSIY